MKIIPSNSKEYYNISSKKKNKNKKEKEIFHKYNLINLIES